MRAFLIVCLVAYAAAEVNQEEVDGAPRFFFTQSTVTVTSFSSTTTSTAATSTVSTVCFSTPAAIAVCGGRRRRSVEELLEKKEEVVPVEKIETGPETVAAVAVADDIIEGSLLGLPTGCFNAGRDNLPRGLLTFLKTTTITTVSTTATTPTITVKSTVPVSCQAFAGQTFSPAC